MRVSNTRVSYIMLQDFVVYEFRTKFRTSFHVGSGKCLFDKSIARSMEPLFESMTCYCASRIASRPQGRRYCSRRNIGLYDATMTPF